MWGMRQNKLSETVRVSYGLSGRKTPGNLEGSVCVVSVPTRMLPERVSSLWPSLLCLMPFVVVQRLRHVWLFVTPWTAARQASGSEFCHWRFHVMETSESFFVVTFLYCIGYSRLTTNVVIVSGEQQSDSAIHRHVSFLPPNPLPSRLPHNTEQSSLCYTVSPCWLSILNQNILDVNNYKYFLNLEKCERKQILLFHLKIYLLCTI